MRKHTPCPYRVLVRECILEYVNWATKARCLGGYLFANASSEHGWSDRPQRRFDLTAVRVMRMLEDANELTDPKQREQIEQLPIQYDPEKPSTTALGIDSWAGIRDPQLRRRACATTAEMERTGLDDLCQQMRERMVWLSEQIAEVQGTAQAGVNTQIAMAEWEDRRAGRIT